MGWGETLTSKKPSVLGQNLWPFSRSSSPTGGMAEDSRGLQSQHKEEGGGRRVKTVSGPPRSRTDMGFEVGSLPVREWR